MALQATPDAPRSPERDRLRRAIRAVLGARRESQTKLAAAVGLSPSQLSRRLTGETPFDEDDLAALARFFECDVADLWSAERLLQVTERFLKKNGDPGQGPILTPLSGGAKGELLPRPHGGAGQPQKRLNVRHLAPVAD